MATYEQITNCGDVEGRNVFRAQFNTNPCSDIPQLQAWDDYNMNSVAIQILAGTPVNGAESLVAGASTDAAAMTLEWVPGTATLGGALINRLRGDESYVLLGAAAPGAGDARRFTLAMGCASDSAIGVSGNLPVFAVKAFYAGAVPDIVFQYNRSADDLGAGVGADWISFTSALKGTTMAIGIRNTIHATGPSTTTSALDPVTKPGSGEKFAEEYWVQTAL